MKICCLSDSHGLHRKIEIPKDVDMILFAGDLMTDGYRLYEVVDFLNWLEDHPAPHKVFIAGNHDRLFEDNPNLIKSLLTGYPGLTYLENSGVEIEGIKIWGTPNSRRFCNWAFNNTQEELERIYGKIPYDTNILISHAPAYGIVDKLERGECIGEEKLREKVDRMEFLEYVICGHVHSASGIHVEWNEQHVNQYTTHINCAVVDEAYKLVRHPVVFDYVLNYEDDVHEIREV